MCMYVLIGSAPAWEVSTLNCKHSEVGGESITFVQSYILLKEPHQNFKRYFVCTDKLPAYGPHPQTVFVREYPSGSLGSGS